MREPQSANPVKFQDKFSLNEWARVGAQINTLIHVCGVEEEVVESGLFSRIIDFGSLLEQGQQLCSRRTLFRIELQTLCDGVATFSDKYIVRFFLFRK